MGAAGGKEVPAADGEEKEEGDGAEGNAEPPTGGKGAIGAGAEGVKPALPFMAGKVGSIGGAGGMAVLETVGGMAEGVRLEVEGVEAGTPWLSISISGFT